MLDKSKNLIKQLFMVPPADRRRHHLDGMIPRVETCLNALDAGVEADVILDGQVALLLELVTDLGAGTLIHSSAV